MSLRRVSTETLVCVGFGGETIYPIQEEKKSLRFLMRASRICYFKEGRFADVGVGQYKVNIYP